MARPANITAEEIVQKARKLFLKQGIARTEMKHIAEACHISRTTLYRYFDSKESIAFFLVSGTLLELNTHIRVPEGCESGFEEVSEALTNLLEYMLANPEQIRLLDDFDCYFSDSYPSTKTASEYKSLMQKQNPLLCDSLVRGIRDGSIRSDIDPQFFSRFLTNALLGVAQRVLPRQNLLRMEQGYGSEYLVQQLKVLLHDMKKA